MKSHTKTGLKCPRCWRELKCPCGEVIFLDHFSSQFAKKGGLMRSKKMSQTKRKEIARLGGLKRQEKFRLKKEKVITPIDEVIEGPTTLEDD